MRPNPGYILKSSLFYRLRCELQMMLTEPKIPILILCCSQYNSNDPNAEYFDLNQFAAEMHLTQITENRPWAVFKVNATNMQGMETSLAWILHHLQYEKSIYMEN